MNYQVNDTSTGRAITLAGIKHNSETFRAATDLSSFFAIAVKNSSVDEAVVAYMVSADDMYDYILRSDPGMRIVKETSRGLHDKRDILDSSGFKDGNFSFLLTTAGHLDKKPNAVFLVSPQLMRKIKDNKESKLQNRSHPSENLTSLYPEILPDRLMGSKDFAKKTRQIEEATAEDMITFRADGQVAAIPNKWALFLKQQAFRNNAKIITDINLQDFDKRAGPVFDLVSNDNKYVRIIKRLNSGKKEPYPAYTLVPGLATEFLQIDHEGHIEGLKPIKSLPISFESKATVVTNGETTKISLDFDSSHQHVAVISCKDFAQSSFQLRPDCTFNDFSLNFSEASSLAGLLVHRSNQTVLEMSKQTSFGLRPLLQGGC